MVGRRAVERLGSASTRLVKVAVTYSPGGSESKTKKRLL